MTRPVSTFVFSAGGSGTGKLVGLGAVPVVSGVGAASGGFGEVVKETFLKVSPCTSCSAKPVHAVTRIFSSVMPLAADSGRPVISPAAFAFTHWILLMRIFRTCGVSALIGFG